VGRVQQAGPRRVGEQRRGSPFGIQIDRGRAAAEVATRLRATVSALRASS